MEFDLPSCAEIRARDSATIAAGTSAMELMERAGRAMVCRIMGLIRQQRRDRVVVLVGTGNNGGDGLVIARVLHQVGYPVSVIAVKSQKLSPENSWQRKESVAAGVDVYLVDEGLAAKVENLLRRADIVVDALLGVAQTAAPRGVVAELLAVCAEQSAPLPQLYVAVDVPTGVNATTGEVFGGAFRANLTLTVEWPKRGFTQYPARGNVGVVETIPIGLVDRPATEFEYIATTPQLPLRRSDGHKGTFGEVLVVGGSEDMVGAPQLSAHAALAAGAGIVRVFGRRGQTILTPEIMRIGLSGTKGYLTKADGAAIKKWIDKDRVFVIGPGLGGNRETKVLVAELLRCAGRMKARVVLDADGLNAMVGVQQKGWSAKNLGDNVIITPHPGEAARLLGTSTDKVQQDRFTAARDLATLTGAVVVLKGAGTIVYSAKSGAVISAGGSELATAGSGDVLAGIIAAFWAGGLTARAAATAGAWVHAVAGRVALQKNGGAGGRIVAGDIVAAVSEALAGDPG